MIDLSFKGGDISAAAGPRFFLNDYKNVIGYKCPAIGSEDAFTPHNRRPREPKQSFLTYNFKQIFNIASENLLRMSNRDSDLILVRINKGDGKQTVEKRHIKKFERVYKTFFHFLNRIDTLDDATSKNFCELTAFLTMRFTQKIIELYMQHTSVLGEFEEILEILLQEYTTEAYTDMDRRKKYNMYQISGLYIGGVTYNKAVSNFLKKAGEASNIEKAFGTTKTYKEARLRTCVLHQLNTTNTWLSYTVFDDFVRDLLDLYYTGDDYPWIEDIDITDDYTHHTILDEEKTKKNIRVNDFISEIVKEMLKEAETWTW